MRVIYVTRCANEAGLVSGPMPEERAPPRPDDTGYDLAAWLAESGRRKIPPAIAALRLEAKPAPTPRRIYFVQPRLLILFALMAGAFWGYHYVDIRVQIEALPSLLFFVSR